MNVRKLIGAIILLLIAAPSFSDNVLKSKPMNIKEKLVNTSWVNENGRVISFDERRVYEGNEEEHIIARVEYMDDKINMIIAQGKATFMVNIVDDGKTLLYSGIKEIDAIFEKKRVYADEKYTLKGEHAFPKPKDIVEAIELSDIDYVKAYEGDINARDDKGRTLLYHALYEPFFDIAEYFIAKGADVNIKNDDGNTALELAVKRENNKMVEKLIEAGATTEDNYNAIIFQALSDGNNDLLKVAAKQGGDFSGSNSDGYSALEASVGYMDPAVSMMRLKENPEAVKYLVDELGFDVNMVNESTGNTALFSAANIGSVAIVKYLLSKGADINHVNKEGRNALLAAIKWNSGSYVGGVPLIDRDYMFETLKLLIDSGVDVNIEDERGITPYKGVQDAEATRLLELLPKPNE